MEGATPTMQLEVGDKIEVVADPAFSIVSADPVKAIRAQRSFIDSSNQSFERFVVNLTAKSPAEMLNEFMHRRQESATARYREIYLRISRHQGIDNEFLFPFRAKSVRDHFRMDLWEPKATYDEFAERLLRDEGRDIAMSRVMALPLPLPPSILIDWSRQNADEQRAYVKHLLRVAHSPTRVWHVARLISLSHMRSSGRLARRFVYRLLQPESRRWFEAFEAMLRWIHRIACYDVDLQGEALKVRLLLEWGHAHEMFLAFTAAGVDLDWIRDQFGEPAGQNIISEAQAPADVASPEEFSVSRFMLFGVTYAMSDVGDVMTLRKRLDAQLTRIVDDVQFPRFSVLRDTALMSNVADSLLQMTPERQVVMNALLGSETASSLSSEALHGRVTEDVDSIAHGSEEVVPWMLLGAVVGRSRIYEDCVESLNDALQRFDFVDSFKRDRQGGEIALHTAIMISRDVRSEATHVRLMQELLEITAWCAKRYATAILTGSDDGFDEEATNVASWLLQMAINLMFGGVHHPISMSSLISELIRVWPATAGPYRNVLQRMFETEPLVRGELLSEAILFARAQAA
jgi:hypothetical protein